MKILSGARGIDTPRQLIPPTIQGILNDGYTFAIRYLSRAAYVNPQDIRGIEAETVRSMGLALGFVQHFPPGMPWIPNIITSRADAYSAVRQLSSIGVPDGKTVWFDLEHVDASAPLSLICDCVNGWTQIVEDGGYQPGVYFGDKCRLGPRHLYAELRTRRYWSAYNANLDQYPEKRGVCMKQHPYHAGRSWADIDVVQADAFGGLPAFWEVE